MPSKRLEMKRRDRAVLLWGVAFFGLAQATGFGRLQVTPRPERFSLGRSTVQRTPNPSESIIQWQSHAALTSRETEEVVFVGDSCCLMGVIPAIVENGTKLKTRNLGTNAYLGTAGHADLLQLYLDRHGP